MAANRERRPGFGLDGVSGNRLGAASGCISEVTVGIDGEALDAEGTGEGVHERKRTRGGIDAEAVNGIGVRRKDEAAVARCGDIVSEESFAGGGKGRAGDGGESARAGIDGVSADRVDRLEGNVEKFSIGRERDRNDLAARGKIGDGTRLQPAGLRIDRIGTNRVGGDIGDVVETVAGILNHGGGFGFAAQVRIREHAQGAGGGADGVGLDEAGLGLEAIRADPAEGTVGGDVDEDGARPVRGGRWGGADRAVASGGKE